MFTQPTNHMQTDFTLIQRDLQHIWHPCTYMDDLHITPPLIVERASGSYIYTTQGPIIDAISSWWCKSLGHGHQAIHAAMLAQLKRFEHVIGANTTHPLIVELAEELTNISQKQHVFFASDGSSAVEIALKLALQATQIKGQNHRQDIIALKNSYHGETIATLSVSNLDIYNSQFQRFGLNSHFIDQIPYVTNSNDASFTCCDQAWEAILPKLQAMQEQACAILVEPILQGAAGMLCYSADFLKKLAQFAHKHDLYLITDEIMTGLGRTGKWLAANHANVNADMICLSKGLTSGSMPLSCVLIDHKIYELFSQNAKHHATAFLHSHTYSGNALAVSAALATIRTLSQENIIEYANTLGDYMYTRFKDIATQTQKLHNIRAIGACVAADLIPTSARIGHHIASAAQQMGALLRPIGNTLYWLPPLNTDFATIDRLTEITFNAINKVYKNENAS